MNVCFRCKKLLENTDKKTCDMCIAYVDEQNICQICGKSYSRTNRNRHYRSFKCRVSVY